MEGIAIAGKDGCVEIKVKFVKELEEGFRGVAALIELNKTIGELCDLGIIEDLPSLIGIREGRLLEETKKSKHLAVSITMTPFSIRPEIALIVVDRDGNLPKTASGHNFLVVVHNERSIDIVSLFENVFGACEVIYDR